MVKTDHIHEEYDFNSTLQIAYCTCGWEWPERTKTWRKPKTFNGILRAANYGRAMDIEGVRE